MAMSIIQNDFQRLTTPYESDLYHQFPLGRPATATTTSSSHTRHSSSSTSYSLPSSNLTSPGDSPPNLPTHQQLKPHHMSTHIRRAREATSPYIRDHHTHSGSESGIDNDDLTMFSYHQPDYPHPAAAMYSQAIDQSQAHHPQQHPQQPPPHSVAHPPGVFGRTTLGPDHALEQLAASVRSATTTSASDRAKQIFVQAWLNANYAPYADGNVPRQGLYFSYRRVCDQYHIPHINTATLGKAIRLCFPNIKTRRLGVRGNSKYHYCGIRPATSAEAEWLQDYIRKSNNLAHQNGPHIRGGTAQPSAGNNAAGSASARDGARTSEDDEDDDGSSEEASSAPNKRASLNLDSSGRFPMDTTADRTPTSSSLLSAAQQARPSTSNGTSYATPAPIRRRSTAPPGQHVGSQPPPPQTAGGPAPAAAASTPNLAPNEPVAAGPFINHASLSVRNLPYFPSIEEALGPAATGSSVSSSTAASPHGTVAREVWRWFEDHLDALLESVRSFRFDQFEIHLRTFWAGLSGDHREVVHAPAVAGLMAKADAIVYDEILETLRSQILVPIPAHSLTSLRQLADKMEKILLLALESYGSTFVEPKVELGARFGHLVLRFLDIFQVTQALSTVLQNPKQLQDMRRSWSEIDFDSVRNQSALVCNCRHEDLAQLLEVDFVALLDNLARSPEPVREVMVWADDCCERLMGAGRHGHAAQEDKTTMSSRSVLIRWGYVTSQIMRDLTIRSDPAFGAFQILKLFLDDWIALNVLRSVALSTNSVAASVEPVMQQHFFTLSPMPGQEFAGGAGLDASRTATSGAGAHQAAHGHHPHGALANMHSNPMLNHTPTTSSMLAALNDPFPGPLNGGAGAAGAPAGPNTSGPGGTAASSGAFGLGANDGSAYSTQMGTFMDTSGQPPNESYSSLPFGDFGPSGPTGFDVNFTQELMATRGDGVDGGVIDASVKDEVVG